MAEVLPVFQIVEKAQAAFLLPHDFRADAFAGAPSLQMLDNNYFQAPAGAAYSRPDDNRLYGCGARANQQYVEWLNFFVAPNDQAIVPVAVTKDVLRVGLDKHGIQCKKSATRKEMLEQALGIQGLLSSLIIQVCPQQRTILSEWKESVFEWAVRVRYVESVGRALIKILAVKGLSRK